jgi:hypothetical protein
MPTENRHPSRQVRVAVFWLNIYSVSYPSCFLEIRERHASFLFTYRNTLCQAHGIDVFAIF